MDNKEAVNFTLANRPGEVLFGMGKQRVVFPSSQAICLGWKIMKHGLIAMFKGFFAFLFGIDE